MTGFCTEGSKLIFYEILKVPIGTENSDMVKFSCEKKLVLPPPPS